MMITRLGFLKIIALGSLLGLIAVKHKGIVYRVSYILEKAQLDYFAKKYRGEEYFDACHVKTTLYNGMPIVVNKLDMCVCKSIRLSGLYEPAETSVVLPFIKEEDVVVEAGANYGYYTLLMAKKVGPTGKVYTFEANPDVHSYLMSSISLNRLVNVVAFNKALADHAYDSFLAYEHFNVGAGYILSEEQAKADKLVTEYRNIRPISVSIIDSELSGVVADVLRMDVEGAEYLVLKGARQLLARSPNLKIIMEWAPASMERLNVNIDEAIDFLAAYKYYCWRITAQGALERIEIVDLKNLEIENIVLSKKDLTGVHPGLF